MPAFLSALEARRSFLEPLPRLKDRWCREVPVGGQVRDEWLAPLAGVEGGGPRSLRLARSALDEAFAEAFGGEGAPRPEAVSLALGTALGAIEPVEDGAPPFSFDQAAEVLARGLARGPRTVFSATCVSGVSALEAAHLDLASGRAEAAAAGSFDSLSRFMHAGFRALGALSPSGRLRPADLTHDGIVLGEAAAFVVLEPLRAARARGAAVSACLAGARLESDALHLTSPDPSGAGMARAIRRVLDDTGLRPEDIGCITLTAAGSAVYDRMLSRAVHSALGAAAASEVPATTWEPAVGHVLAATGVLAVVHAASMLSAGSVPPLTSLERPDPECPDPECRLRYVTTAAAPLRSPVVLALLVGFGGQNGAAVVVGPEVAADLGGR
jgi:3-oxoacyl-[acyl-carrier-protein] synthase II